MLLPDPDGALDLTPAAGRPRCATGGAGSAPTACCAWCAGTRSATGRRRMPGVEWFMDYRNADGSSPRCAATGCGCSPATSPTPGWLDRRRAAPSAPAAACARCASTGTGEVAVDMGPRPSGAASRPRRSTGRASPGSRSTSATRTWPASPTPSSTPWTSRRPPGHDPALFPHGVNVEFVLARGRPRRAVRMRVHERGVGETRSCGTGTVAAAVAALHARRPRAPAPSTVHTPGGRLRVERRRRHHDPAPGRPVLVAHGDLGARRGGTARGGHVDRSWNRGRHDSTARGPAAAMSPT